MTDPFLYLGLAYLFCYGIFIVYLTLTR